MDDDYDNEGNNIVPCPICLNVHCPSKEDGKCPDEDMFMLEAEIRTLLDEYKATDDNSRIANVLEAVEKLITTDRTSLHTSLVAAVEGKIAHEEKIEEHIEKVGADKVYTNGKKAAYQDTLTIIDTLLPGDVSK